MVAMIITRRKLCSKLLRGRWMLLHYLIQDAVEQSRPPRERCSKAGMPFTGCFATEVWKMKDIILIDAGTGNLRSVQKALEKVGATVERTDDPQKVSSGKKVVLPGVGAFGDFMAGLRVRGLEDEVKEIAARGVPLLGICVGMQALFELGEEMGEHKGLGLLAGNVVRFDDSFSMKIPHTGWNQVRVK